MNYQARVIQNNK